LAAIDQAERSKELARRYRERWIILITLVVVVVVTYLETHVVTLAGDQPLSSSLLIFALININALLLLLLIFLVFRNLFKLLMERKGGVLGSKLRTKLVVAFVLLTLVPTGLLFFAAYQFVDTSIEYWFQAKVERSLFNALVTSESYNKSLGESVSHFAELLAKDLKPKYFELDKPNKDLSQMLETYRSRYDLAAIRLFNPDMKDLAFVIQSGTHVSHLQGLHLDLVSRAMAEKKPSTKLRAAPTGDFAAAVHPYIDLKNGREKVLGAVVAYKLLPANALAKVTSIRKGLEEYRQLKAFKQPIKTNQYITLSIVTLLIIFAATWFGFYLAKSITVPIRELAEGTQRIAGGDYDFFIDLEGSDEIGTLVNAFNRMTADLKTSKARLDETQREMQLTNLELERRRRYMEVVLENVAAGVISVDAEGRITTVNPSAERLFKVQTSQVLGRRWQELLGGEYLEMAKSLGMGAMPGSRGIVSKQVRLNIGGDYLALMVHVGFLYDEIGNNLGMVVVFEDLTELEKAQRMAAWREVARRIAHEVKNPLTPIKLSAQRLIRRYSDSLPEEDGRCLPSAPPPSCARWRSCRTWSTSSPPLPVCLRPAWPRGIWPISARRPWGFTGGLMRISSLIWRSRPRYRCLTWIRSRCPGF
jgi:two-component system nitrogen regulation sensor histidine kinase NtrY